MKKEALSTQYFTERTAWRKWLAAHFDTANDVWLEYPKKSTGKKRILYNDAVEEALCFGWIDSTVRSLDEHTTIQRFCKRRAKSSYSQANRERLKWLFKKGWIRESIIEDVQNLLVEAFVFPEDIIARLKAEKVAWQNYQSFSAPYRRIRIAYIESARKRPAEFEKRLHHFLEKTSANKQIKGFGGIDKYY